MRKRGGKLEFIRYCFGSPDEYAVLARTEQGFWATVFDFLYETDAPLVQLREAAGIVGFRFFDRFLSVREKAELGTFELHQAYLNGLVTDVDREVAQAEPLSGPTDSRRALRVSKKQGDSKNNQSTAEERSFLKAIRATPGDRTARLVYADWLEEHNDARGKLIRIEEELQTTPIHSDRYWELKPRRRALLASAERAWLKQMGYGSTDYQPVFADVPAGWKERWRLLREFIERWHQIPIDDVGGPLKPIPRGKSRPMVEADLHTVNAAMNDPKVSAGLPPSLREWIVFIRDLQLGLKDFGGGSGDQHVFWDSGERISFLQRDGGRDGCFVRGEQRHDLDPPVWWEDNTRQLPHPDSSHLVSPRVTTLALHYLLTQYEPEFGESHTRQNMTKKVVRQLANYFPVQSEFDGIQMFERHNVIALWIPESLLTGDRPCLHVKVRPPANPEDVHTELWELDQ